MRITAKRLFVLCGGQFYMDWLLVTNWNSRHKFLRRLWYRHPAKGSVNRRLRFAAITGYIHLPFFFLVFLTTWHSLDFWINIYVNVYPCVVQLYIGYRCLRIKAGRYRNKKAFLKKKGDLEIQYPFKSRDKIL